MMVGRASLVVDIGKTNSKLSLWSEEGACIAARTRANATVQGPGYAALDVAGIEAWLAAALSEFTRLADIGAIVPVGHGAAAALIVDDRLALPPMCYEEFPPPEIYPDYDAMRDPFAATGSPRLPQGLNLGAQLYRLETLATGVWPEAATLLTYPQYWAWRLCGVAAAEFTSLGCHTDLWRPFDKRFTDLAVRRGWAERIAPLRGARDVLGSILPDWAQRTGLPKGCRVLCGLHDSNAAFHGVRSNEMLAGRDVTVLSTGTWFVAMRAPAKDGPIPIDALKEGRDTLINVDVNGDPVLSARFMGGREVECLVGGDDSPFRDAEFVRTVVPTFINEALASGSMILPSFARNVGPFASASGRWEGAPLHRGARRAAVGLYLALVADASLSLIGARDAIVVEGRFAGDTTFVRMLASLRRDSTVYLAPSNDGLTLGALKLLNAAAPSGDLIPVEPLDQDISAFAARWRELAANNAVAA